MPGRPLQTASQADLPPEQPELIGDPLERANTRFNPTRTHRYTLFRNFGDPGRIVMFCLTNPSGADRICDDRTVAKVTRLARRWKFGAMYVTNIFALRSTDPAEIYAAADPVGPENDRWIREIAAQAERIVVGWGKPGAYRGRGAAVAVLLREAADPAKVFCFTRNQDGSPVHPLYQPENRALIPFFAPAGKGGPGH